MAIHKKPIETTSLLTSLKEKAVTSEKRLREHHSQAVALLESVGVQPGKIREHAARIATTGALAGTLLLGAPAIGSLPLLSAAQYALLDSEKLHQLLVEKLADLLPKNAEPLTSEQELKISQLQKEIWGVNASAELENERLNRSYGLMGAEQHLPRFPGDTINQHDEYQNSGLTPGLGAWGYFSPSSAQLTTDLIQKEKYYVAVQTLYLPDWEKRLSYLREWYKYRKVIVVNPANGKTIVCDIADSGPASWTGKHFGGSPEVMAYLGLNVGQQKGPVILFFLNDPENKISLGPLGYNINRLPLPKVSSI